MPKKTSGVTEKDLGWKRIKQQLSELGAKGVKTGLQAGDTDDKGTSLAEIGFYQEIGTEHIPARSFIRSTTDEQRQKWERQLAAETGAVIDGKKSPEQALGAIGEMMQADIQRKITTLSEPPNAPSTIAKKGSSNPLIDRGDLRRGIRYVVEK